MECKYMLMKDSKGPFTVTLLAERGTFIMKVNGRECAFTSSIERWMVYYLYIHSNGKGEVIRWLREIGRFDWTPNAFDHFIENFLRLHPRVPAQKYAYELIPLQACKEKGLELPIPYYSNFILSYEGEKELMAIFIETPAEELKGKMLQWLRSYCSNYGYDFSKKGKGNEYEWLYISFLEQHGLYIHMPKPQKNYSTTKKKKGSFRIGCGGYAIILIITCILCCELSKMGYDGWSNFFGIVFFLVLGIVALMWEQMKRMR